jgi:hypothetical protein
VQPTQGKSYEPDIRSPIRLFACTEIGAMPKLRQPPYTQLQWQQLEHAAASLKLALGRLVAREASELDGAPL